MSLKKQRTWQYIIHQLYGSSYGKAFRSLKAIGGVRSYVINNIKFF